MKVSECGLAGGAAWAGRRKDDVNLNKIGERRKKRKMLPQTTSARSQEDDAF